MTSRFMLIFAAISGFIFVALGAFGAHVLSQSLGAAEMAGSIPAWSIRLPYPGDFWSGGGDAASDQYLVLLEQRISGVRDRAVQRQLYCLALSHLRLWAFVTPVGGVSFLAGWVLMLIGAIRLKRKGVVHE